MSVKGLTGYIDDLTRMKFVTKYEDRDGNVCYKLTELGKKAGMSEDFKNQ